MKTHPTLTPTLSLQRERESFSPLALADEEKESCRPLSSADDERERERESFRSLSPAEGGVG